MRGAGVRLGGSVEREARTGVADRSERCCLRMIRWLLCANCFVYLFNSVLILTRVGRPTRGGPATPLRLARGPARPVRMRSPHCSTQ